MEVFTVADLLHRDAWGMQVSMPHLVFTVVGTIIHKCITETNIINAAQDKLYTVLNCCSPWPPDTPQESAQTPCHQEFIHFYEMVVAVCFLFFLLTKLYLPVKKLDSQISFLINQNTLPQTQFTCMLFLFQLVEN